MSAALASEAAFIAQRRFRVLMDAFARPGTIHRLGEEIEAIDAMPASALAGLYALADFETSIHLSPSLAADSVLVERLRFETLAKRAESAKTASFAVLDARRDRLHLAAYHQGAPDYPDRSTTLFVLVESLSSSPALVASGPGIKELRHLSPSDLPSDFLAQWTANRAGFPLGVDIVFCAGTEIIALPRSIRLEPEAI
jgi:alpha-D-ribose 1-methylphosphonate 5-triphosphate synthase subunit PhnH